MHPWIVTLNPTISRRFLQLCTDIEAYWMKGPFLIFRNNNS
jgi:hypothetical protein